MRLPGLPLHNSWREALFAEIESKIKEVLPSTFSVAPAAIGEVRCCHANGGVTTAFIRDCETTIVIMIPGQAPVRMANPFLRGPLAS